MIFIYAIVLILLVGLIKWLITFVDKKPKKSKAPSSNSDLKVRPDAIRLPVVSYKVITNSYYEDAPESGTYRTQAVEGLMNRNKPAERVRQDVSQVKCEVIHNGQSLTLTSDPIYKDGQTLEFFIAAQPGISVYMDKDNVERYYIDLEFLT